ncbi:hypothetical protein ACJX0J_032436, partial [Zea mays]
YTNCSVALATVLFVDIGVDIDVITLLIGLKLMFFAIMPFVLHIFATIWSKSGKNIRLNYMMMKQQTNILYGCLITWGATFSEDDGVIFNEFASVLQITIFTGWMDASIFHQYVTKELYAMKLVWYILLTRSTVYLNGHVSLMLHSITRRGSPCEDANAILQERAHADADAANADIPHVRVLILGSDADQVYISFRMIHAEHAKKKRKKDNWSRSLAISMLHHYYTNTDEDIFVTWKSIGISLGTTKNEVLIGSRVNTFNDEEDNIDGIFWNCRGLGDLAKHNYLSQGILTLCEEITGNRNGGTTIYLGE